MAISMELIKELRERTSAGMSDCKKALEESSGDIDKAVEIILKKGQAKSAKRAGNVAAEGQVRAEVYGNGRRGVVVEVNIETDFSARNDKFKALVDRVVAAARDATPGAELAKVTSEGKTLIEHADELTAVIGEKINLRRFSQVAVADGKSGLAHSYVHMGGKIGVVLAIQADSDQAAGHEAARTFADETAMQIAAMSPLVVGREDLDDSVLAKQREIFEAQLREDPKPKPEKLWPNILEGKVGAWCKEVVLLDQESAQHKKPIKELLAEAARAAGGSLEITAFVRYELGEGIEKKKDDLAKGVAELVS